MNFPILVLILMLWQPSWVFAVSNDQRISDDHGHVVGISSAGGLTITQTADSGTVLTNLANDKRISDNDSDVVGVTSGGLLQLQWR